MGYASFLLCFTIKYNNWGPQYDNAFNVSFFERSLSFGDDGLFTPELYVDNYNNDLANNYGNLVSRTISMIVKYFDGVIPEYKGCVNKFDKELEEDMKLAVSLYQKEMDQYHVTDAFKEVFNLLSKANKYVDNTAPWALAKDEALKDELASVMVHLSLLIKACSIMLSPVLIESVPEVFKSLNVTDTSFEHILDYETVNNHKVIKGNNLFFKFFPKIRQ